jgi:hypothetical protein
MVVWNLRDVKRDEIEKITKLVCKKILLKKKLATKMTTEKILN